MDGALVEQRDCHQWNGLKRQFEVLRLTKVLITRKIKPLLFRMSTLKQKFIDKGLLVFLDSFLVFVTGSKW